MRSRTGILATTAAGTSLVLHALLFSAFRVIEIPTPGAPAAKAEPDEIMVVFEQPAAPVPDEFPIGEVGAKGYASHRVEGPVEAVAPEAPVDQAALSLDPVGPDRVVEKPADTVGDSNAALPALPKVVPMLARLVESMQARLPEVAPVARGPDVPAEADRSTEPESTVAPLSPPAPPAAPVEPVPVDPTPVVIVRADAAPPAPPTAPLRTAGGQADPAPMSDSESDPFSVLGSAQYRDGRLSVRAGRKVRSRRPKIGLAGQVDLYQRKAAQITLRVSADATGKVTGVEVLRSSGSNEIDQPCRVAMYDWWFEPKKDSLGNPVPDTFNFTIGFQ